MGCASSNLAELPSVRSISRPRAPKKGHRDKRSSDVLVDDDATANIASGVLFPLVTREKQQQAGPAPSAARIKRKKRVSFSEKKTPAVQGVEEQDLLREAASSPTASGAEQQQATPKGSSHVDGTPQSSVLVGKLATYEILESIGSGAYATVMRARNAQHAVNGLPQMVAIKVIDVNKVEGGIQSIENEVMIMECLSDHAGVCTLFEAVYSHEVEPGREKRHDEDPSNVSRMGKETKDSHGSSSGEVAGSGSGGGEGVASVSLVMELIEGGDLFERVSSRGKFTESDASLVMADVLEALGYLHSLGVVHRDIKPENVCFGSKESDSAVRLIDFGYASVLAMDGTKSRELGPRGYCGTARYLAPEQLEVTGSDTTAHDLWACGCLLYILLCGYPPFTAEDHDVLFADIKAGRFDFPAADWSGVSDDAKALVRSLLEVDPEKRLTADEASQHNWITTAGGQLDSVLQA